MKKFEVVQNIPSPYRVHLFREMHKQLKEMKIGFHVNFMSDMSRGHDERPLSWRNPKIDFPHTYWNDFGYKNYHWNPGLVAFLKSEKPDYLLVGSSFDTFTSLAVRMFGSANIKCAWSEGNTKTPGQLSGLKGWVKRFVFSGYDYVAVPGVDAARYIGLHQGCTKKRMPKPIFLPNLVDENRFCSQRKSDEKVQSIRDSLGIDSSVRVCLTPARLEPVKGLAEFISLLTPEMLNGWLIVIVGEGSLKNLLLKQIRDRHISSYVKILDFVPYKDMPNFYLASDLFILPSLYDPNPLSVVEALHSGLPIALSDQAGNVEEAVEDRINGWVLPVHDREKFQGVLKDVFTSSKSRLTEMGLVSCSRKARYWQTKSAVSNFLAELINN